MLEQLQGVGFYKQLYELKVMLELPQEWWSRFVSSRNLERLVASLATVSPKTHI